MKELPKQTKIIATIGPASLEKDVLIKLIQKGVDVFRLNASHFKSDDEIRSLVKKVRRAISEVGVPIGMFLDLQGPKIRVGEFKNQRETLLEGQLFTLREDNTELGTKEFVGISYPELIKDMKIGETIFINDGNIKLEVIEKKKGQAICRVIQGGFISNKKGVNLPSTQSHGLSAITERDLAHVKIAVEQELEYIALSFVSKAEEIADLRNHIKDFGGKDIGVIAKIERRSAVDNIKEIIKEADVIMVARGDLGVEIGLEKVPEVQKMIIREAIHYIKPVIVATQMLESMIETKVATRAEVSDVANAIYDGCDAVMLSGETAIGINPENAVEMMRNICLASDKHKSELKKMKYSVIKNIFDEKTQATSLCKAADQIAEENNANVLLAFTSSGTTPLIASKLNPTIPIIAPTDSDIVLRKMCLYRGVIPLMISKKFRLISGWSNMINIAVQDAIQKELIVSGDKLVVTAGIPIGFSGGTNSIRMIDV